MPRITTFKEWAKSHDGVTTYADVTAALGGETSDIMDTAFYDMKNYDKMVAIVVASNVVSTHVLTIKMSQATDTDGSGSATITGASTTYTSTQATDVVQYALEVDAEDLTDAYDFVGVSCSTDDPDGTEAVMVLVIPCNGRYGQATPPA